MKKSNFRKRIVSLLMAFLMLLPLIPTENYSAATSYTNAKEFYETCKSAKDGQLYHAEMVNGCIYYATRGKLSSSSTNLQYTTIGFDITLSANGYSVSFALKRPKSSADSSYMKQIDARNSGGYEYILYSVEDKKLYELAKLADYTNYSKILDAEVIDVRIDAVMTTKRGNSFHGSVIEDGKGGLKETDTVYHLKKETDWKKMKSIFSGHDFFSYRNVWQQMENHLLQIRYNVLGTENIVNSSSTTPTVGSEYSISSGYLYKNGAQVFTKSRVLKQLQVLHPYTASLEKTGYHLSPGEEWITDDYRIFVGGGYYMPKDITAEVGVKNKGITMYANWKPNTFVIRYDANGGYGQVASSKFTYDVPDTLRANGFERQGYSLVPGAEWNTMPDGSGESYSSMQVVQNLTDIHEAEITLYANWQPNVIKITTDKQGGTGGTDSFYQLYDVGFYSDESLGNPIYALETPYKQGHNFIGYYRTTAAVGEPLVDANGNFASYVTSSYFITDTTIYASYEPKQYTITFDKQGGEGGTDSVTATYGELVPAATAPVKKGMTFKGYYTQRNGEGEMYYSEYMVSHKTYMLEHDLTLYAHWEDATAPTVTLTSNIDGWTNQPITLTAGATDDGSGLSEVSLYRETALEIADTGLNGLRERKLTFVNQIESAVTYRAIAIDMKGNMAETYKTVYYDITPPKGRVIYRNIDGYVFSFTVEVTDVVTD